MLKAILLATLLLISSPAAAVPLCITDQDGNRLVIIDPERPEQSASIGVAERPAGVAVADGLAYLSHPDSGLISIVDLDQHRQQRQLTIGGTPFGLAADGAGHLLVADWSGNQLRQIDLASGQVTRRVATGRSPAGLVIDRRGDRLYLAERESNQIGVYRASDLAPLATIAVGRAPFALALSPDGRRLYVGNVKDGTLSVIDTTALMLVATIAVGPMPYGVAVSGDGRRIAVTLQDASLLAVLSGEPLTVTARIKVGRFPEGVLATGPATVYVAGWFAGALSVIDLDAGRETGRVMIGGAPRGLAAAGG